MRAVIIEIRTVMAITRKTEERMVLVMALLLVGFHLSWVSPEGDLDIVF